MQYYTDYRHALLTLFPDIGLDVNKFSSLPQNYWKNADNQRRFFMRFAQEHNFNYQDPRMWYKKVSSEILEREKGGSRIMSYYNGYINALMTLFPDIGLDQNKLRKIK